MSDITELKEDAISLNAEKSFKNDSFIINLGLGYKRIEDNDVNNKNNRNDINLIFGITYKF